MSSALNSSCAIMFTNTLEVFSPTLGYGFGIKSSMEVYIPLNKENKFSKKLYNRLYTFMWGANKLRQVVMVTPFNLYQYN